MIDPHNVLVELRFSSSKPLSAITRNASGCVLGHTLMARWCIKVNSEFVVEYVHPRCDSSFGRRLVASKRRAASNSVRTELREPVGGLSVRLRG